MTTATAPKIKDAIVLLKEDHKKVKGLFDDFEKAKSDKEKERIAQAAIKELKVHASVEEEIFYPTVRAALAKDEDDQELLNEATEEHRVAKTLIEALENKNAADEDYCAKFTVLAENVRHHIKEEEEELFPDARETDIDFKELGAKMEARKEELMSSEPALEEAIANSEVKPYQELAN